MTQERVARAAQIEQTELSNIEREMKQLSGPVTKRLTHALRASRGRDATFNMTLRWAQRPSHLVR